MSFPESRIPNADSGGATTWVIENSMVKAGRWRCRPSMSQRTERSQPWPMVSFCHGGAYTVETNKSRAIIDSNTVLFIGQGEPYETRPVSSFGSFGTSLSVSPDAFEELHDECPVRQPSRVSAHADPKFLLQQAELFACIRSPSANLRIEEVGLRLFLTAWRDTSRTFDWSPKSRKAAAHVSAAREILAERFHTPITITDLAKRIGVSPFYLCHVFGAYTGTSLHQYVISLRLSAAIHCLAESKRGISEIAALFGFSQHSHFTRAFRRRFGIAPSELRRRLHGNRRALKELTKSAL